MNIKTKAVLALVAASFFWGLNFHLLKIMLGYVFFIEAGFWRYLFGVATLTLISIKTLPSLRVIKLHRKGIIIVGIFGLFGFNLLLFTGLKYTSSLNAALIISLSPIVTLILSSLLLKVSVNLMQMAGACFGILGVLVLLSSGELSELIQLRFSKGDLLILLATLLSSCYHVWVKKYAVGITNWHFTLLTNLICLLAFSILLPIIPVPTALNYTCEFWASICYFRMCG